MNIGYFFWGHLSDKLGEISKNTPDGNAWYSSSIIEYLLKQNHTVYGMSIDRDKDDFTLFNTSIFNSFAKDERIFAYSNINWIFWNKDYSSANFPNLDILLLEWRFLIKDRNTEESFGSKNWQPDLRMQNNILSFYKNTNTKIIIFDLDYKITESDEEYLSSFKNLCIFETAKKTKISRLKRISVEIPFWIKSQTILPSKQLLNNKNLVYIGSNYEREESINKYIIPFSNKYPFTVWFYGNWRNYPEIIERIYTELKWRDIQYHSRVGHSDFYEIYNNALFCPLLAKKEYYNNGFMTARIQECLYFGAIPIGVSEHNSINKYLPSEFIVNSFEDICMLVKKYKNITIEEKDQIRNNIWKNLEFMDISYFIQKLFTSF